MTNYKLYKILSKEKSDNNAILAFHLDDYVRYESSRSSADMKCVACANRHPFDTYRVGEYLRVDLDRTSCQSSMLVIFDDNIVRKVNSPTNIISSSGSSSFLLLI